VHALTGVLTEDFMANGTACFVVAVVVFGATGCGGDSKGGGAGARPIETSVDGSKTFDSLTPDEVTQVCKDLAPGLFDASCRFTAEITAGLAAASDATLTDAQLATACGDELNRCQTQFAPDDCANVSAPPNCTATVAEYVACLVDYFAVVPACVGLTRDAINAAAAAPYPASCDTVRGKCATLAPQ